MAPTAPLAAPARPARAGTAEPDRSRAPASRDGRVAVAAWLGLVGVALWWGRASISGRGLAVNAAPLAGHWVWQPRWLLLVPAALGGAVVGLGPRVAARLPWPVVPAVAGVSASAWATALAASDGWSRVTQPLTTRHEYEPFARTIDGAGPFLRDFVAQLPGAPIHVQGHPPGAPLVPWVLDSIGLGGAGWFAALVLLAWGLAVGAALVAVGRIAGAAAARRAAPALVLLPAAVWAGTSADALFAGVLATGVALAVARRPVTVVAGGLVLGVGLLLTYGAVLPAGIPVLVHLRQRRPAYAALVAGAAVAVLVVVAIVSGFSWLDGLAATRAAYERGVASDRPSAYFALVGNPAALALMVGPGVALGLVAVARRWREASALLPLAALLAVVAADASLLSKGEVERIWLPFVPWLALAAPGHRRGALAAQAGLALLLQAWLRSKW
jgi:hypothetical protein